MEDPRIMFCLGATKAGTSWLYRCLSGHSEVHLRSIKELHYFDALEAGRLEARRVEVAANRDRLVARHKATGFLKRGPLKRRIADHEAYLDVLDRGADLDAYRAYLIGGRSGQAVVGDFTPAYGLLPEGRLAQMASLAPDVRFVYLLRDPVERLWSHVRMIAARRAGDGALDPKRAARILNRTIAGEETEIVRRSDYRATLKALFAAVDPSRRLVTFYEDLFSGVALGRICRFLGIAPLQTPLQARVHAGQPLTMTADQRTAARAWLAPQYDFVRSELGSLPAGWQTDPERA